MKKSKLIFCLIVLVVFEVDHGSAKNILPLKIYSAKNKVEKPNTRIVAGSIVPIESVPFQAQLYEGEYFICGGTIIHKRYVLTAAHCTTVGYCNYSVTVGSAELDTTNAIKVIKAIVHPKYNKETFDYDIAVLKLEYRLTIHTSTVAAIPIFPANTKYDEGYMVRVSGWGDIFENVTASDNYLRAVDIPMVSWRTCNFLYNKTLTNTMVCAGPLAGGKDACNGDSGSPLFGYGRTPTGPLYHLIGLVSFGEGSARENYPGVYTYLSHPKIRC